MAQALNASEAIGAWEGEDPREKLLDGPPGTVVLRGEGGTTKLVGRFQIPFLISSIASLPILG